MKCIVALAALAATSLAATGSSSSSNSACSKKITVKGQSEINTINSCSKFNSDVVIDGISGITAISMDNVEQINGELIIQNMFQLETISLGQLTYAKGFKVVNNTQVYKVAIPKLSNVDGDFQIIVNPNLKELQANITKVKNYQVIDTHVGSLGLFSANKVNSIEVLSNPELQTLDFSSVQSTTGYINIANNGKDSNITFSSLTQVGGNVSFGNAAALSISKLSSVGDDFSLYTNFFENITLSSLQTAKKSITLSGNKFESISFPKLSEVGSSLNINNNTNFKSISASTFPELTSIPGGMILEGSFDNITFPKLKSIDGQVTAKGHGKVSCEQFSKDVPAAQTLECSLVAESSSDSSDGKSAGSGSSGSNKTSKKSGASQNAAAAALGGFAVLVAAYL